MSPNKKKRSKKSYASVTKVSLSHKKCFKSLGKQLEEIRISKGISVLDLCDKVEISRTTYYRIINGLVYFKTEKFMKICDELSIEIKVDLNQKDN